ncbi:hypothetical protein MKX03_034937 [Papaver bracteatum]|nr:hypothetical protein MKX03_034937 [Papaver bracteatum]
MQYIAILLLIYVIAFWIKKQERNNRLAAPLLPHDYEYITRNVEMSSEQLLARRSSGIFLNQNKEKYCIDGSGRNCFMLFPRMLNICWGDNSQYWVWRSRPDSSRGADRVNIEVAEVLEVCWLDVNGRFDISKLNPGASTGWDVPVNLRLILPDGQELVHEEDFETKPESEWIDIYVGDFTTPPLQPNRGKKEISFRLFEHGGNWKRNLVVKGVIIRPNQAIIQNQPRQCMLPWLTDDSVHALILKLVVDPVNTLLLDPLKAILATDSKQGDNSVG